MTWARTAWASRLANWRCTARPAASRRIACCPSSSMSGTNNVELREDPLYLGLKRPRLTGAAYYEVVDEFVTAVLGKTLMAENADPVRGL